MCGGEGSGVRRRISIYVLGLGLMMPFEVSGSDDEASTARTAEGASQPESVRNYLAQPFNSYSFWNLPVHVDAWSKGYYKPAHLQPLTFRTSSAHNDLLFLDPSAPERQIFRTPLSSAWDYTGLGATQNRIKVRCDTAVDTLPGPKALIPDGFSTITDLPGLGATPDLPTAILNPANAFEGLSVRETQPLEVCPDGKVVAAVDYAREFPIDERGDGRCGTSSGGGVGLRTATCPTGSQGATGLPASGGLIRRGEFSAGEIRHALKLSIPVGELYGRNRKLNPAGFVWPANGIDSYADVNGGGYCGDPDGRAGTNRYIYSGSQYVLDPIFDMASLRSAPGLIIAKALRDYGAYVVDTLGPPCSSNPFTVSERTLHVEMGPGMNDGRPDVRAEFLNLYGYDMDVLSSAPQTPFSSDMATIWSHTYVMWHPCMNDKDPNGGACAKFVGGGPTCDPASKRRGPIVLEGTNRPQCPAWAR